MASKEKRQYLSRVRVAQHSLRHVIHLPRIPLSAHSLYSSKRFQTFLRYALILFSRSTVFISMGFFYIALDSSISNMYEYVCVSSCVLFIFHMTKYKMKNDLLFFDIQLHDSRIDLCNAVERQQKPRKH